MKRQFTLTVILLLTFVGTSLAQATAFTYQGKLTVSGAPASGNYDFEFRLYDAVSNGTQQGATVQLTNVAVANGIFTVSLDFGTCPTCFNGAARFLDISVRLTGGGAFTPLTPRQPITSTPYAMKTVNLTFNAPYNDGATIFTASNTFAGEGAGVNTIPDPTLNNPLGKLNSFYGAGAGQANTTGVQNAFFGTQAGQANTSGVTNAFFGTIAGFRNTTGFNNTFIGYGADFNTSNPTGSNNTLLGADTRIDSGVSNGTAIGAFASVTQSDSLVLGNGLVNVGIGTTAPAERLHVVGNGLFTGNLTVNGTLTAGSVSASSISGVVGVANGGTGLSAAGAAGSYLRSNGAAWASSALQAADVTGTLGAGNGGTGLSAPGAAGSFLRSNGAGWTSAALQAADLPSGSGNYIQNSTSQQASGNFNVSGNGTANILNAVTQYNLNGLRAFTVNGAYNDGSGTVFTASNTFTGDGAGGNTTPDLDPSLISGKLNSFYGAGAGRANTSGFNNAFFGSLAGNANTGNFNAFFGAQAGQANTGAANAFFGANAGRLNTNGSTNAFFGYVAGSNNTSGQSNTFIGAGANFNVVNTTGNNNTLLGSGTSVNSGITNATAIGANASVIQSHSLVLGAIKGVNGCETFNGCDSVNVGIGTTAPNSKLHISGTGVIRARVDSDSNAGLALTLGNQPKWSVATVTGGNFQIFNDATGSNALWINSTNNFVGIGTTSPDQLLTVNGNASKVGGGSWATFSDERLKNIRGYYTRGLQAVMQLQPIRYEYKPDNALELRGTGEYVGFSAQEVERILPEAVSRSTSGYLQINNDPILWTMLNAVKEQQAQIAAQQAQLKQQTEQIQSLQHLLDQQQHLFNRQQQQLVALEKRLVSPRRKSHNRK